ncbi:hypothetical protein [Mariprofundus ferrooxydans]|uniref:Nudix hydrolase domain-containing protein n=1 Tax=Mariprofundus ferrooxydans PV-1 TaxID=314345 RepID=Q0F2H8_9PROT|nr:hypothetical protein [Mariprofundus ferrooxydans]EAU55572.1 hypothetical protein SPV1_01452 [Mariprofundus ferrooxydans PV-1]KON48687.1 hypothetical protein AL013_01575 [Mariprofundus ferrooxydans]
MDIINHLLDWTIATMGFLHIEANRKEILFFISGLLIPYSLDAIKAAAIVPIIRSIRTTVIKLIVSRKRISLFEFVDKKLTHAPYCAFNPPIFIDADSSPQFTCKILRKPFLLAPPELDANAPPEAHDRLLSGQFAESHTYELGSDGDSSLEIFNKLIADEEFLATTCLKVRDDFLACKDGFHFNGKMLAVANFQISRTLDELPSIKLELQETDYYSYRVISEAASKIRNQYGLDAMVNGNFNEYLATAFQRYIHLSLGLAIIVHTLQDNRIIITRRSSHAANNAGEAGAYFMSVNEGINTNDIDPNNPLKLNSLHRIVLRSLEEELFGASSGENLLSKINHCAITGAFVYQPNMSIDLALYVSVDCDSTQIRQAYRYARDGGFETSEIIDENRWDKKTGLPRFDEESILSFLSRTVGSKPAYMTWDEGALVTVALSTLVR